MALAAQTWWSDSSPSRPKHFAGVGISDFSGPGLGTPRPSLGAPRTDEVAVALDLDVSRSSRNEPTALSHGRTYRTGVGAPEKSSLPFFVLIGLAVGLFAFAMMHFCLPDPFEKIAAREAAAAQTFPPPPVFKTLEAPPVAEMSAPPAEPSQVTVTTITPSAPAKQARVIRRQPAKKSVTAKLPSNPYATAN